MPRAMVAAVAGMRAAWKQMGLPGVPMSSVQTVRPRPSSRLRVVGPTRLVMARTERWVLAWSRAKTAARAARMGRMRSRASRRREGVALSDVAAGVSCMCPTLLHGRWKGAWRGSS